MKVTKKGQVRIPVALRERFGLNPGTEVEFVAEGKVLQLKPREGACAFDRWYFKAVGSARPGMTTDQIMAFTRG